jgi:PBSX family phage terminase large subunit
MMDLYPKQRVFFYGVLKRINLLVGSIRAGKTWVSLLKWAFWVAGQPKEFAFLMTGRTLTTLKRNCLLPLQKFIGAKNFSFSISGKEGQLFGHTVYFEGASDETAEDKIQGLTLAGAYCDEIALYPQGFITVLLGRLSDGEGVLIGTCNPENPQNFIKTEYIDKADDLDLQHIQFLLTDNTFLSDGYVKSVIKEMTGVYYQRFILGLWVRAEGLVFETFAKAPEKYELTTAPDDLEFITIGTDFGGNKSKTIFTATGFRRGWKGIVSLQDHKIKGEKGTIDPNRVYDEYVEFVKEVQGRFGTRGSGHAATRVPIKYSFADSAEQYLIAGLQGTCRKEGLTLPVDAKKIEIRDRVLFINRMINSGRYQYMKGCEHIKESLCGLSWNNKEGHEDELLDIPGQTPNDGFDGLSYSIERFIPYFEYKGAKRA